MNEIITIDDNEVNELFINIKDLVNQSRNKVVNLELSMEIYCLKAFLEN